jgi:hypothetical protein
VWRDLYEGRGGYECRIHDVAWLGADEVRILRTLDDRRGDLVYNVRARAFADSKGK